MDKHLSDKNRPEDGVTAEQQTELIRELESQLEVRNKRKLELHLTLETHKKNEKQLAHYRKELEQQEEVYINWAKLNDLFGSQTGSKFKEIAQGYTAGHPGRIRQQAPGGTVQTLSAATYS